MKNKSKDSSKKLPPDQLAVKCLALMLVQAENFDEAYAKTVAELKQMVRIRWAPLRIKRILLDPMAAAMGDSLNDNPKALLEALYTNDEARRMVDALNDDWKKRVAPPAVVAPETPTTED